MENLQHIFPLPLVAMEDWFIVEESPAYPKCFWIDLDFSGRFEQNAFKKAVALAIKKHPIFSALFQGDIKEKVSKNFWIEAKGVIPFIDWDKEGSPLKFPKGQSIDLRQEIGVRFFIRETSHKTKLLIQVHHACSDGIGAIHFIIDLLRIYALIQADASGQGGDFSELKKLENELSQSIKFKKELLLNRDHYQVRKRSVSFKEHLLKLREIILFHIQFPKPLAVSNPNKKMLEELGEYPAYISYTFTKENTNILYLSAMKQGVAPLSLLSRDLFLAIDYWNKKTDSEDKNRPIRIAIPTDLRHLLTPNMPAIVAPGLIFIYQKRKLLEDPERLLKAINKYILRCVKRNWGLIFVKGMKFFGKFKRGISTVTKNNLCWATTFLTYFGEFNQFFSAQDQAEFFRTTGLKLDHLSGAVILTHKTYVGFFVGIYNGRLNISLTYQSNKILEEDARELLSLYVSKISNSMNLKEEKAPNPAAA
jgi:hypothetical protein